LADRSQFAATLADLVSRFVRNLGQYRTAAYSESALRQDFLDPLWEALGWDVRNTGGLPLELREVEVETRVDVAGRQKRADYTFRIGGVRRFVCEAKKPAEDLARHAYQAQRYAYNLPVHVALLTDFEDLNLYVVGSQPDDRSPFPPAKTWHFQAYVEAAEELWDFLSHERVEAGSLDRYVASLPKRPSKGRGRRGWVFRPERRKQVDYTFLTFVEQQRTALARDLVLANPRETWDDLRLNEAIQRIIDRILFVRICEDRDIDTGKTLERIVQEWIGGAGGSPSSAADREGGEIPSVAEPRASYAAGRRTDVRRPALYPRLVAHFRRLDKGGERPFNGGLFARHFSEDLRVSDSLLVGLIEELSADESPYLFNTIPVEILGSVYERFISRVVHVTAGGNVTTSIKPEVRKSGGVYYTPRYVVDYIVDRTLGELIRGKTPKAIEVIRVLDPACGSGSFLIAAFERIAAEHLRYFSENPGARTHDSCYLDDGGNLRLTTGLKRKIVVNNLHGVDIDAQAVEVTQLSLYLKILEGETRNSLAAQRTLFPGESLLPELSNNIRLGNSVIESDYFDLFDDGDQRMRVRPFDWKVAFGGILGGGGFHAVIGNPPYVRPHKLEAEAKKYFWKRYRTFQRKSDLYCCFLERATDLLREGGRLGFIVSRGWLQLDSFKALRELLLERHAVEEIVDLQDRVFEDAQVATCILVARRTEDSGVRSRQVLRVTRYEGAPGLSRPRPVNEVPQEAFERMYAKVFDLSLSPTTEAIKDKMRAAGVPLGQVYLVCFGLKTGDDARFIHLGKRHAKDRPLLRGENVMRYGYEFKAEYVWYVPERMRAHRRTARPGEPWRFEQPKVLIKDTTTDFAGTYDDEGYYVKDMLIVVPDPKKPKPSLDLRALAGILNSSLMSFYYRTTFPTLHVQQNELASLPIPADLTQSGRDALHGQLVSLVGRMLELVKRRAGARSQAAGETVEQGIRSTDLAIEEVVRQLYLLTPEEAALARKAPA
jgi:Eco57I restriction-modification methylase/restriction endonuclease TaqI-like protein